MVASYNFWLVLMSVLVAIFASYTALNLATRITASKGNAARVWLVGGAVSMGTGIWSMHFIGMLAFSLPIPMGYDMPITLLSMLIAIVVSGFALHVVSGSTLSWQKLLLAGALMGAGICAMHYTGMAAMQMYPPITYDPAIFAASVVIAIAASYAALWIAFTLRSDSPWMKFAKLGSSVIMGFAIVGMHYTGMAAAQFAPDSVCLAGAYVDNSWMAGTVAAITFLILCITLGLSLMDARMESNRARMLASLQISNQEQSMLRAADRSKDEFLAMLGHELRNPLSAVSNAATLLTRAELSAEDRAAAQAIITRQTGQLTRLVNDLLDVGRVVAGKIHLEGAPADLEELTRAAISAIKATGRADAHRIAIDCPEPVFVQGDRTRLEQVVTNLVMNAIAHTPPNGAIDVSVAKERGFAVLRVEDSGEGIRQEDRDSIFELFYQADKAPNRAGGLGIGLTLVKRLAELHRGSVSVYSAGPGMGATFTVRLPLLPTPPSVSPNEAYLRAASASLDILVIDDSADIGVSMSMLLESEGHVVHLANDGPSGIRAALSVKPRVALVDIGMPGMDGYEVARKIRGQLHGNIFLIAMTGYGHDDDIRRAMDAGFDAHVIKPAELSTLNALFANLRGRPELMRN